MKSNSKLYANLIGENESKIIQHADSVKKAKFWESDYDIRVVCQILKCDVLTYSTSGNNQMSWFQFKQKREGPGRLSNHRLFYITKMVIIIIYWFPYI